MALIAETMQNSELLARQSALGDDSDVPGSPCLVVVQCTVDHSGAVFTRVSLLPCPSNRHSILDNVSPVRFIASLQVVQEQRRNNRAFISTDNSTFFNAMAIDKNVKY